MVRAGLRENGQVCLMVHTGGIRRTSRSILESPRRKDKQKPEGGQVGVGGYRQKVLEDLVPAGQRDLKGRSRALEK